MTPLAALAAAARDRLLAGAVAPLPGVGTLVRAHVSARVHVAPDGSRMLLPPGEAIGLSPNAGDPTDLASALVRLSGAPPQTSATALRAALDQFEARLAIVGEARLDGVGLFQRTSGGVRFAPDPDLLAAVNQPFQGLAPVAAVLPPAAAPAAPAPEARVPVPAWNPPPPDAPPDAVDILLDLIVNEPQEDPAERAPAEGLPTTGTQNEVFDTANPEITVDPASVEDSQADTNPAEALPVATDDAPSTPRPAPEPLRSGAPTESAFADDEPTGPDPSETEPTYPVPTEPEPDEDEPDDGEPVLAVPFGAPGDGADLRDALPPTPADHEEGRDWQTRPWGGPDAHDLDDNAPRPIDFPDDGIEDADYLDVSPYRFADPPVRRDAPLDASFEGASDMPASDVLAAYPAPTSETALDAFAAAGADPPRTPFVEERPAAIPESAVEEVPAPHWARRGWIALLVVLALALAALLLWWFLRPQPAPAETTAPAPAVAPREAVDSLGGGRADGDSAATVAGVADSSAAALVAAAADSVPALPPAAASEAPPPASSTTPGAPTPAPRTASGVPPAAARVPGDARGLAPNPRLAILPARLAGLPAADAQALAGAGVRPSSGAFTWVVLSTPARAEADALAERYRTAGYRTGVLSASQSGRPVFRVVVGAFDSREQAFRLRDRLPPQAPPDTWPLDLRAL